MSQMWEKFIQEQIKRIKEDIKHHFAYDGENSAEYESVLKRELKEFIDDFYANIEREFDGGGYNYKIIFEEQITNDNEFRKMVIDTVFPLALEHTDAFKIEEGSNNAANNIKKILQYSPDSIDTIMPIIIKLDEKNLDIILKEYPQFEDKIQESIKQNDDENKSKNTTRNDELKETLKKIKEINARFEELMKEHKIESEFEYQDQEKVESSTKGSIRAKLEELLKGYMEISDGYDELEGELNEKSISNGIYKY